MLSEKILYRKKLGFPVPLNNWFGGAFNEYAKSILLDHRTIQRGIINERGIEKWLNDKRISNDHGFAMKIWMLINAELFNRRYFN